LLDSARDTIEEYTDYLTDASEAISSNLSKLLDLIMGKMGR